MTDSLIHKINELLRKANFETFALENFSNRKTKFCFDLLVKKDDSIFSVKVFPNIDNINPEVINDIKSLSLLLKSKPLLIGLKNRYQKLEDNTIYVREGLPFITLNTLENILMGKFPYVLARRGGGVIFLNGKLMKNLRERKSISRKDLSEELNVTPRTICAYENESMRPSEEKANKILKILNDSEIFKQINLFQWKLNLDTDLHEKVEDGELNPFEAHIQDVIKDIGISTYWYKKGPIPFKLSIYSDISEPRKLDNFYPLFSGISNDQKSLNELNLKCLQIFNKLFHKNALLIVNNQIKVSATLKENKIPIVRIKELEKIDDEEGFIDLIQES